MGCEYIFNGNTYSSYQELIDGFSDADLENALSILFSQTDKQTAVFDSLMELKRKHQYTWDEYNVIDGDPSLDAGERMSIQKFIDSHYFFVEG